MTLEVTSCVRLLAMLVATVAMFCVAAFAGSVDYQSVADGTRWGWRQDLANPLGCLASCGPKYDIRLLSPKNDRGSLEITILLGNREIYSWKGHRHSVFRILDDTLYFARLHPSGSGGSIVAVDLETGNELWVSQLRALGPIQHSAYRTLMNLDANRDVVSVFGNETMGRYVEIKSAATGKTLGHKVFPHSDDGKDTATK